MQIIDGRKIRDEILITLQARVEALSFVPIFCDVLVGSDPASLQYVQMKNRTAENIGIQTHPAVFPESITTDELISEIKKISEIPHMAGLIIQLPLPAHIDVKRVLDCVPVSLDVDAISTEASNKFYADNPVFVFPTAAAIMKIFEAIDINLVEKKVVMVGQGMLVGKPVVHLLHKIGVSVSVIDIETQNKNEILKSADIIISATGEANLIKGDMLKDGVVLIDAGTSESNGGIAGDVDRDSVENVASMLSPVPGGVGPVTVAMLMQNVVMSAERMS
ncbi:MAG: bifunctional 5,10-methylenetetrahydrofolate dehydrogenase/5,10-methenyltetrahydrofolate cyclohydrolase [bacterium]